MVHPLAKTELSVVTDALQMVAATDDRYAPLMRAGIFCHPIPYFGSLSTAKVITLGLNPSAGEFETRRKWPRNIDAETLAKRLIGYFRSGDPPPHRWFDRWNEALSHLAASYQQNAAHIDLSPRATRAAGEFKDPASKSLFLEMLKTDASLWISALDAAREAWLIIAAGSVTNQYYINEYLRDQLSEAGVKLRGYWRRGVGPGQTAMHALVLPSGREIPLFFCSTGPTNGEVLPAAVASNAGQLRDCLWGRPGPSQGRAP